METFAEYDFYAESFGGNAVPRAAWLRVSLKATIKIKELTLQRADPTHDLYGEQVKFASCAVAELLYRAEEGAGSLPVSESVGGDRSVTYGSGDETLEYRCYKAASSWLSGTGLMYRGINICSHESNYRIR